MSNTESTETTIVLQVIDGSDALTYERFLELTIRFTATGNDAWSRDESGIGFRPPPIDEGSTTDHPNDPPPGSGEPPEGT